MLLVSLSETIKIPLESKNSSLVPTAADSLPTYSIRDGAGLDSGTNIATGTTAAISGVTGGYRLSHAITSGNGFAVNTVYHVIFSWAVGGANRSRIETFLVT